ncbi:MAG: thioredoxin family protein [Spirochaetota bacterium]
MKNRVIAQWVIIGIVVLLIGGIFILKNSQKAPTAESTATIPAAVQESPVTGLPSMALKADSGLHVTSPINFDALRSSGLPIIIDFGADSCIPCKEMAPILEELNKTLSGKAIILFVDVWKYRNLAQGIPIQVIPTQIFFDATGKPFTPSEGSGIPFNLYTRKDTSEHIFTIHEGGLDKAQMLALLKTMGML